MAVSGVIKTCVCKHEYQDRIYGEGRRVHTSTPSKKGATVTYRCTVCGKEKGSGMTL